MFLLAVSVQYKLAALETGFHFPYVVRVVSLRSVHCLTDIILAHRRCLLGTANEPKLALRDIPFLQPYVHEVILSPPSRSEVNHERTSRSCRLDQAVVLVPAFTENVAQTAHFLQFEGVRFFFVIRSVCGGRDRERGNVRFMKRS